MIDVRQETEFALALQRRVLSGDVAPAAFQRPYVWTETDVENLWDSILSGLPIGSFLLWRPPGGAGTARLLGPIRLDPSPRAALVLDGQNRLATLAWSATDPDGDVPEEAAGRNVWMTGRRLVADASAERVRFIDPEEAHPWTIPMHFVGHGLQSHLRTVWDGSAADLAKVEWLERLEGAVRGARIVITTITAEEADARRAYLRMASSGVPISPEDLDDAITGAMNA